MKRVYKKNDFLHIYLATDPDREGEAIAYEIIQELKLKKTQYQRLLFFEITPNSIIEAINSPSELNWNLVEAQMSRQALDKMIGFCISPALHKQTKAYSAGRVQSVVLKLIIERELIIEKYRKKKEKYTLEGKNKNIIVTQVDEKENTLFYQEKEKAEDAAHKGEKKIKLIKKEEKKKKILPHPPFTTSTLLSQARFLLSLDAGRTTGILQKLYEGVKLKGESVQLGLITYPRTDSIRVNETFTKTAYHYVKNKWGKEFWNPTPHWKEKKLKHSQEAHESIHPTYLKYSPETIKNSLEIDEYKVYKLIFENTISSFMIPAEKRQISYLFADSKQHLFLSNENICCFLGFLVVNPTRAHEYFVKTESELETIKDFLVIEKWEAIKYEGDKPTRYNEGTLIQELERLGIGRPSTYSTFAPILLKRRYIFLGEKKTLCPFPLGWKVNEWLQKNFNYLFNQEYTANLEEKLDEISQGNNTYKNFIKEFWKEFSSQLKKL